MDNSHSSKKKNIAIIGGGAAGVYSIIALKEEGFEPVCFELSDRYGGIWNYREEAVEGFGSLMPTTIVNQCKEIAAMSNFPPKKEYSIYMRHQELFQYITDIYKHFECERHIRFNTEVINLRKTEDYADTGRMSVTVRDRISEEVSTHVFDGVMVATGHFSYPKMETFPGLENFKGAVIHTHSLKKVDKYVGKNVLVIGAGCSGLDAAEFISPVAKQVYLSVRSGMFVLNRLGPNGYPIDYLLLRRHIIIALEYLPVNFASWYLETFYMDTKFDHNLYRVKPKYHVLSRDPVVNDAIAYKLLSGSVVQKGAVKEFTENGVLFDGDETVTEIDAVIMATGYTFKFPFLEDGLLEIEDGRINLYKCMYPTHLPHSSLVFIGFVNPFGPGFPIGELQCRLAALLFAGKRKLPSNGVMLNDATERHRRNLLRYVPSEFMSIRVDVLNFMDELAPLIGCKPNLLKYLFTDFSLFLRLVFGPSLPYQYRLEGPNKWDGAREAIMTCEDRMRWPLTREKRWKKSVLQLIFEYIGNLIPKNIF